jgi:DNA-binding CsgD family transcriptional regulator
VVLVSDPAALVLPEASRQTDLYGLTPAQARVARELATGKSSKDVARALNVSPETVRTQTRDVYQKMRILSQADLVRCILTLWHASV